MDHATSYVIQWLTEAQWTAEMMQWTSAEEGRQQGQRTFGYTLVGLTPETPYVARIRAENAFGPGPWTEASFTSGRALPPPAPGGGGPSTSAPGAPGDLTVVGGDGEVVLTWRAPSSDGGAAVTDYEYRINGSDPWIPIGSTGTTHTVTGLVTGTAYVFEVRAVNAAGRSASSNRAEAKPEEPRTVLLAHFANGNNTVFNSRVYLFNPSVKTGRVTVRVFTLPLRGGLAQELTTTPLELGSLGPKSGLNIKLVEDILTRCGCKRCPWESSRPSRHATSG